MSSSLQEDVDNKVQIIHQNPLRLRITFNVGGRQSLLLELFRNGVADGLGMAHRSACAYQKITREGRSPLQVQDAQVQSFPISSGLNRFLQLRDHHPGYFPLGRGRYRPSFRMYSSTSGGTRPVTLRPDPMAFRIACEATGMWTPRRM